jgi:hypothetical protein
MASQYSCIGLIMRISKDVLPKFECLKIALYKNSKGDVMRWVFAKCAHIFKQYQDQL